MFLPLTGVGKREGRLLPRRRVPVLRCTYGYFTSCRRTCLVHRQVNQDMVLRVQGKEL